MEKQYDLLRLVVQKMEIHTEADERDISGPPGVSLVPANINWSSPLIRRQLTKQATVVSHWSKITPDVVKKQ